MGFSGGEKGGRTDERVEGEIDSDAAWRAPPLNYGNRAALSLSWLYRASPHKHRITAVKSLDPQTKTELEAAAFRRLVEHLGQRSDVQNIDLMNLAGFCRNCLGNWLKDAADARGVVVSKEEARTHVYGMPQEEWKALHQREAGAEAAGKFKGAGH